MQEPKARAIHVVCTRNLSRIAGSINLDSQRIREPVFGSSKASKGGHIEEEGGGMDCSEGLPAAGRQSGP